MPYVAYTCSKCGRQQERHHNAHLCINQQCRGRLVAADSDRCPTCKRPFGASVRRCAECRKPILRGHKFLWVTRKGLTTIIHRNCKCPGGYR